MEKERDKREDEPEPALCRVGSELFNKASAEREFRRRGIPQAGNGAGASATATARAAPCDATARGGPQRLGMSSQAWPQDSAGKAARMRSRTGSASSRVS